MAFLKCSCQTVRWHSGDQGEVFTAALNFCGHEQQCLSATDVRSGGAEKGV